MDINEVILEQKGFCQGAIVTNDSGETLYILLSQDCDLASANLEAEPFADACKIEVDEGCNSAGSYRKLCVDSEDGRRFSVEQKNRELLPRDVLYKEFETLSVLNEESYTSLKLWLCGRFLRPSFPDAFNKSTLDVVAAKRPIRKLLGKNQGYILGIYVYRFDHGVKPYQTHIMIVVKSDKYDEAFERELDRLKPMLQDIEQQFGQDESLELVDGEDYYISIEKDYDLTLHDIASYVRIHSFDHYSDSESLEEEVSR